MECQMRRTSWGNGALDPADVFVPTQRTADRGNASGYANKELDALLDAANTALDQAKRAAIYHQAAAIVNKDLPVVYLWVATLPSGISDQVSGWPPSADHRLTLTDACMKQGPPGPCPEHWKETPHPETGKRNA